MTVLTGEHVVEWRTSRRLSQAELARQLGIADRTLRRWETGERSIPGFLGLALAALDVGARLDVRPPARQN